MAVPSKSLAHNSKTQWTFRTHLSPASTHETYQFQPTTNADPAVGCRQTNRAGSKFAVPNRSDVVAVIDDDAMMREALQALLSSLGYTVDLYESGEAFLERATACRAICLLIDVHLGSGSGIDLARQLVDAGLEFPIMFMTENSGETERQQVLEVGCVGYLQKPLAAKLLSQILARSKIRNRRRD